MKKFVVLVVAVAVSGGAALADSNVDILALTSKGVLNESMLGGLEY